jgi:squalene-hopene/tetraprenyl-beta-curcumene cyclase
MTVSLHPGTADRLRRATAAACEHLLSLQAPTGFWKGELETNVTMDAEDLLLREFLGVRTQEQTRETARWIRGHQRADGTWATFYGGPADLSTTVEAYVALRLAGDPPDAEHMSSAAAFVRDAGGVEASRVFTRTWLALFGLWSWDELPALPPELVLLPRRMPLNIYEFACWARQTLVPLTIVTALRPVRPVGFDIRELHSGVIPQPRRHPLHTRAGVVQRLDRAARAYGRRPIRRLREHAMRRAEAWVVARQEADGSWGGIQPPWVYSLIALHVRGRSLDDPVMRAGLEGLNGFTVRGGSGDTATRWLEACQSPVWDTALAIIALSDAGLPPEDPALIRAAQWLLGEEVTARGDWAVQRPRLAPGGWAFEFANDGYPDIDDTAEVVLALRRVRLDHSPAGPAIRRALGWVVGMRSGNGAWGAFDADNTSRWAEAVPFCDFGAITDPPTADVTAHVVEMLAGEGLADHPVVRRAVRWLLDSQEADGSWFGRWGVNYIYGTGAVVPALVAAGVPRRSRPIRLAVRWLLAHQNVDGGWGEDLRSYRDRNWAGRGTSTASQTGWALLALLAAGERSASVDRGVRWLLDQQEPDGGWDEPQFTGTGFPGDFSINYHLYRLVFPLMALGRYANDSDLDARADVDLTGSEANYQGGVA